MDKVRTRSIRFYTTFLLSLLALLFSGLIIYNNRMAFSMLLNRVYLNTQDTVMLYQKQIDHEFARTETFLYTVITDDANLVTLKYADESSLKWYLALYRLEKSFKNALPVYGMDGFFCYIPEKDCYLSAGNSSNSFLLMRDSILKALGQREADFSAWFLLETQEGSYFLKIIGDNYSYIGAWIGTDTLLDLTAGEQFGFSSEDGQLLRRGTDAGEENDEERFVPEYPGQAGYTVTWLDGEKQLVVFQPMEHARLYLTRIVPYSEISDNGRSLIRVILIVSAGFLMIWLLLFLFFRGWIRRPVMTLTGALYRFRSGDLDVRVSGERQPEEFQMMIHAFNGMVSEIRDLKIDAYERRIEHQELEIQYLKQQITPHFMINCLNTAYQLTETDHSDLARKMLTNLSCHLRYTLSSGQTVFLREELAMVENYIELSKIRYPDSLALQIDCMEECRDAAAIPLLILNFVENSVKHEVLLGTVLVIHADITHVDEWLRICIWDSGRGFSDEALQWLRAIPDEVAKESGHIGISNVVLRARQVYQTCEFTFSNREGAGAQIDIRIPFRKQKSPGDQAVRTESGGGQKGEGESL